MMQILQKKIGKCLCRAKNYHNNNILNIQKNISLGKIKIKIQDSKIFYNFKLKINQIDDFTKTTNGHRKILFRR